MEICRRSDRSYNPRVKASKATRSSAGGENTKRRKQQRRDVFRIALYLEHDKKSRKDLDSTTETLSARCLLEVRRKYFAQCGSRHNNKQLKRRG